MDDLSKLSRDELNTYAGELGMADAAEYPNKAELIAAIDAATTPDAPSWEAAQAEPEPAKGDTYTAIKGFTVDDGRTIMPGDTVTIDASWPARRAKQLLEQGYIKEGGG
jgi:hypothetical protein